jgi:hypothetical protein
VTEEVIEVQEAAREEAEVRIEEEEANHLVREVQEEVVEVLAEVEVQEDLGDPGDLAQEEEVDTKIILMVTTMEITMVKTTMDTTTIMELTMITMLMNLNRLRS